MNQWPVGNQVECLFCFTTRVLTEQEEDAFLAGQGLPQGVGVDQTAVFMDWKVNGGAVTTLSGGSVIHDGTGAYHGIITVAVAGTYEYRGYSKDGSSNAVAATPTGVFVGVAF